MKLKGFLSGHIYLRMVTILMILQCFPTNLAFEQICHMETFKAKCHSPDEVIMMTDARFGRMRIGRCVKENLGDIGCQVDMLHYLDSLCSGKKECEVKIPDDTLHAASKCKRELTPYLEADYQCVKVIHESYHPSTCLSEGIVTLTAKSGLISSLVVGETTNSHSWVCPWVIQAQEGQRINLTLIDFGTTTNFVDGRPAYSPTCNKYASLKERGNSNPTVLCSGSKRERNVLLSQTHRVEIEFLSEKDYKQPPHFLLKYNIVGCPAPRLEGHTVGPVYHDTVAVRCNSNDDQWELRCKNGEWIGPVSNCTIPTGTGSFWHVLSEDWASPEGILITVGLGIALGIIIGVSLLLCVLSVIKRNRRKEAENAAMHLDYEVHPPITPTHSSPTWQAEYEKYHYQQRTPRAEGHYAPVWSPESGYEGYKDVIVSSTIDPRRPSTGQRVTSETTGRIYPPQLPVGLGKLPSPPVSNEFKVGSRSDHVYEKPT